MRYRQGLGHLLTLDLVIKPCRDLEQALSTTKAFCNKIPRSDCKTPGCPSSAGRQNYRNAIQDSTAGLQDTRTTWFLGYIYIYTHIYYYIWIIYIYIYQYPKYIYIP